MAAARAAAAAAPAATTPPLDGGLAAWLVVAASFVVHIQCLGTMYTFTLFIVPYQREFGLSAGAAALPGSIATGIMLASGPLVGRFVDRCGSRSSLFALGLLHVGGMFAVSVARSHAVLVLAHVVAGLGMAVAPASIATVQQWFDTRRAMATGLALAGSGAGQFVLSQLIAARMKRPQEGEGDGEEEAEAASDWRAAAQALTLTAILLLLPSSLLLRSRVTILPPQQQPPPPPQSKGQAAGDGSGKESARDAVATPAAATVTMGSLMRDRPVLCVFGCVLTGSFGMVRTIPQLVDHSRTHYRCCLYRTGCCHASLLRHCLAGSLGSFGILALALTRHRGCVPYAAAVHTIRLPRSFPKL